MAVLSKTQSVLTYVGGQTYQQIDEETGVVRRTLYLDIETFQDLGSPDEVTITVEPGATIV